MPTCSSARPSVRAVRLGFVTALLVQVFDLVLSPRIVKLALPRIQKYLREPDEARRWLADIVAVAHLVRDTGKVTGICRDPADDIVLAAAVEGRACAIVTGDDDLLGSASTKASSLWRPARSWP